MILYCCTDLIFATKIRSTAESVDVSTQAIKLDTDLSTYASDGDDAADTPEKAIAVMVDLELGEEALSLIEQSRAQLPEATVIAFGSHVAKAVLDAAKQRGAHKVMPRSAFTEQLPQLLRAYGTS